jgi:DNA adenine methylase
VTTVTRPAIRYHGGKFRIASWVLSHFPPHELYVEAFGGAAGVLLQKPRAPAEVYNDLDGDIVNFFRVLREPDQRQQLETLLALTPWAREEFEWAWQPSEDPVERARRTAIRAMMGFGSAGASKGTTGFRVDVDRDYGGGPQYWQRYPEQIRVAGQRMQGVLVEHRPAIDVLQAFDTPRTLHYVDPPYVHETRVMRNRTYRHEMTDEEHAHLLDALRKLKGMVVVSGYPTRLYADRLADWHSTSMQARISAGRGGGTRTEVLWINPACRAALDGNTGSLFEAA